MINEKIPAKNSFYSQIKKPLGVLLVILGLILHLIPLFPAGGIIIIGLELLGLRILFQEKIKKWLKDKKQLN